MDPIHFLAIQALPREEGRPATQTEIDAFYECHGHRLFVWIARARRWAFGGRPARSARRNATPQGFARLAPKR